MVYEVVDLDLGQCRAASGALLSQLRPPESSPKPETNSKESQPKQPADESDPGLGPLLGTTSDREDALRRTIDRSLNEWEIFARDEYSIPVTPDVSDPRMIDTQLEAMEDLQRTMLRAIAARTSTLRRLRNQSPILHRIPPELFIYILLLTVNFHEDSDDVFSTLRTLCLTCRYWRNTVLTCSLFWPKICSVSKVEFRDIILRRNPYGALQILCKEGSLNESALDAFLALSAKHSYRWQALTFQGPLSDKLIKHLEAPAPGLLDLFMDQRSTGLGQKQLKLSDGCHLRHVDLDGVTLPWDIPRLTGLRSLQIRNIKDDFPSAERIAEILAGSPELWWLLLADFETSAPEPPPQAQPAAEYDAGAGAPPPLPPPPPTPSSPVVSQTAPVDVSLSPVYLPNLSTLIIQSVPESISSPLLSAITVNKLEKLVATELSPRPFTQRGSNFQALVGGIVGTLKRLEITYNERSLELGLLSERIVEVPNEWIHHIDECPGLAIRVKMPSSSPPTWEAVSKFIGGLPLPTEDSVILFQEASEATPFPLQALDEWDFITELEISPNFDPRALFAFLACPQTVDPSGAQKWPLPNLKVVHSRRSEAGTEEMKDALVGFLRRSNAGAVGVGVGERAVVHKEDGKDVEIDVPPRPKQLQKLKVHFSIVESLKQDPTLAGIEIVASA